MKNKHKDANKPHKRTTPINSEQLGLEVHEMCFNRIMMHKLGYRATEAGIAKQICDAKKDLKANVDQHCQELSPEDAEKVLPADTTDAERECVVSVDTREAGERINAAAAHLSLLNDAKYQLRYDTLQAVTYHFDGFVERLRTFWTFTNIDPHKHKRDKKISTNGSLADHIKQLLRITKNEHHIKLPSISAVIDHLDQHYYSSLRTGPWDANIKVIMSPEGTPSFLDFLFLMSEEDYVDDTLNSFIQASIQIGILVAEYFVISSDEHAFLEDVLLRHIAKLCHFEEYQNVKMVLDPFFQSRGWFTNPHFELRCFEYYCDALKQLGDIDTACATLDRAMSDANALKATMIKCLLRKDNAGAITIARNSQHILTYWDFKMSRYLVNIIPNEVDQECNCLFTTYFKQDYLL